MTFAMKLENGIRMMVVNKAMMEIEWRSRRSRQEEPIKRHEDEGHHGLIVVSRLSAILGDHVRFRDLCLRKPYVP